MVAVFRRTGVDRVSAIHEEDPKEFLIRLHAKLLASGLACEVLSGFLLPAIDGKPMENCDWRVTTAREVQDHLEGCDTEEDRNLVNQLAFEAMTGFLKQGLLSLLNSMRSSQRNGNEAMETSPRIEESSETKLETGRSLFASSRDTTTSNQSRSSTGH